MQKTHCSRRYCIQNYTLRVSVHECIIIVFIMPSYNTDSCSPDWLELTWNVAAD